MKHKTILTLIITIAFAININAKDNNPYTDFNPEYTKVITGRADKIVQNLGIEDTAKYNRVLHIIVEQFRSLSAVHDFKDAQLEKTGNMEDTEREKAKQAAHDSANSALYILHAHYLANLKAYLTFEQIEMIKDGMTYSRMQRDIQAFYDMIPSLTDEEKRYIYAAHYEARELAMDQGSSKAKHHIFDKYRGRVNNYLSQKGYDLKAEREKWEERNKK